MARMIWGLGYIMYWADARLPLMGGSALTVQIVHWSPS
jgi:hypothetical protein